MADDDYFKRRWLYNQFHERNPGQRNHPDNTQTSPLPRPEERPPLWFVWGEIKPAGDEFVVTAWAIPNNGPQSALKTLQRTFQTEAEAHEGGEILYQELRQAVRAEGGRTSDQSGPSLPLPEGKTP